MTRFGVLALLVFAACSADRPPAVAVVRDSAGVMIVESAPIDWSDSAPWRVTAEPLLSVGAVDGDGPDEFHRVRAVRRAEDGRLFILDNSSGEVRIFSRHGQYLRSVGGKGIGPGEFRFPVEFWITRGDSLVVWESHRGPLTVFDSAGSYVRTHAIDSAALLQRLGDVQLLAMLIAVHDGTMIVPVSPPQGSEEATNGVLFRPPFEMMLVTPDLASAVSLGHFGGPAQHWEMQDGERIPILMPFTPHYQVAVDAEHRRVAIGNGDLYQIRVFGLDGSLEQIIRRPQQPTGREVADFEIKAEKERWLAGVEPERRPQFLRQMELATRPQFFPAHDRLIFDKEGNLWIQEYGAPADTLFQWTVFGPDGGYRAHVATGADIEIQEIGPDYVAGVQRDALDVERVVVYGLKKAIE